MILCMPNASKVHIDSPVYKTIYIHSVVAITQEELASKQ
jgi:hypothetical protein